MSSIDDSGANGRDDVGAVIFSVRDLLFVGWRDIAETVIRGSGILHGNFWQSGSLSVVRVRMHDRGSA